MRIERYTPKHMSTKQTRPNFTPILLFLLFIFLSGCALLPANRTQRTAAGEEATPTPIPTAIQARKPTYEVARGEVVDILEFSGRITAVEEEDLFFGSDGRVRNLWFERDDMVEEGDVIADLEIDDLERDLVSAQLELERAQSRLEAAQRELEFDRREAQVAVDMAEIQLEQLRRQSPPPSRESILVQEKQVELAQIALERLSEGVDPLLVNDVRRVGSPEARSGHRRCTTHRPI